MKARIAVALVAVLALVAGGGTVWWLRGSDEPVAPSATPTDEAPGEDADPSDGPESAEPSPSEPALEGKPVASCAPEEASGRLPRGYWGMHLNEPVGAGFPDAPVESVNLTTAGTYWYQVETAPGAYDFSDLDAIVATAEDRGAQPMVVLGFTPSFHSPQPESPTARATMPDLAAWQAWVTAVVDRYGTRVDYQVWPEPNIVSNWEGTPEQMARLTALAGEIVHARAPRAKVVAPATALRLRSQQRWVDRFWATRVDGAPVGERVDAVALDPFPLEDGAPEDAVELVCEAEEILAAHDVSAPVWTNEINYGVPSGGHATDVRHYPDPQQAAYVARTYVLHAALGLERVYWLGWFSTAGMAVELARDGVTTPAGRAYTTVHDWLGHGPRPECRVAAGVHACVVETSGRDLRVYWRVRGSSVLRAPDGARRLETVAGESRRLRAGERLRVEQSPVAVFTD